ncbi:MAG TPA: hypothetical protein VL096_00645 [Pirellulaceae bacterium]|nr:hypothetical protein [Pirellulaceae bacterium]
MVMKAGVWIDHKQAIVVLVTNAGQEIKKIDFDNAKPGSPAGKSLPAKRYTRNDFVAEDKLERKLLADRKSYYDDVLAAIQGAESLLLLGPAEAKGELGKRLKAKKITGIAVTVEAAEKMTDRQLVAKVQKHFAASTVTKSSAPKKTAKKATKKVVKKAAKKARK